MRPNLKDEVLDKYLPPTQKDTIKRLFRLLDSLPLNDENREKILRAISDVLYDAQSAAEIGGNSDNSISDEEWHYYAAIANAHYSLSMLKGMTPREHSNTYETWRNFKLWKRHEHPVRTKESSVLQTQCRKVWQENSAKRPLAKVG